MNTPSLHNAFPGLASASDFAPLESSDARTDTKVGHLAATGFGVGGTIGAVIGAIAVGVAALTTEIVLPGSSLFIGGPLSAVLLGAGAGAANGGLAGALIGWGIPVEISADAASKTSKSLRQSVRSVLCPNAK